MRQKKLQTRVGFTLDAGYLPSGVSARVGGAVQNSKTTTETTKIFFVSLLLMYQHDVF